MEANRKVKFAKLIIAFLFLAAVFAIAIKSYNAFKKISKSNLDEIPPSFKLLTRDSNVIANKYWDKLQVKTIYQRKNRKAISWIELDSKYDLVIYEIDSITNNFSLKENYKLKFTNENIDRSTGELYNVILFHQFFLQHLDSPPIITSNIDLTVKGDTLSPVINQDTLVDYRFLLKNFSLKYGNDDPIDFLLSYKDIDDVKTSALIAEMLLLNRNHHVYLLLVTPVTKDIALPNNYLLEIVEDH